MIHDSLYEITYKHFIVFLTKKRALQYKKKSFSNNDNNSRFHISMTTYTIIAMWSSQAKPYLFTLWSSNKTWSNSLNATTKTIALASQKLQTKVLFYAHYVVLCSIWNNNNRNSEYTYTCLYQCIHLRLSFRWPPTSTILNFLPCIKNSSMIIPVVLTRASNMSSTFGTYSSVTIWFNRGKKCSNDTCICLDIFKKVWK